MSSKIPRPRIIVIEECDPLINKKIEKEIKKNLEDGIIIKMYNYEYTFKMFEDYVSFEKLHNLCCTRIIIIKKSNILNINKYKKKNNILIKTKYKNIIFKVENKEVVKSIILYFKNIML